MKGSKSIAIFLIFAAHLYSGKPLAFPSNEGNMPKKSSPNSTITIANLTQDTSADILIKNDTGGAVTVSGIIFQGAYTDATTCANETVTDFFPLNCSAPGSCTIKSPMWTAVPLADNTSTPIGQNYLYNLWWMTVVNANSNGNNVSDYIGTVLGAGSLCNGGPCTYVKVLLIPDGANNGWNGAFDVGPAEPSNACIELTSFDCNDSDYTCDNIGAGGTITLCLAGGACP